MCILHTKVVCAQLHVPLMDTAWQQATHLRMQHKLRVLYRCSTGMTLTNSTLKCNFDERHAQAVQEAAMHVHLSGAHPLV